VAAADPVAASAEKPAAESVDRHYTPDPDSVIVNPERGFFIYATPFETFYKTGMAGTAHGHQVSIVHASADLGAFTETPISQPWLDDLALSFKALRENGLKVILRFTYSPSVDSAIYDTACPDVNPPVPPNPPPYNVPPDASLELVKAQILQLKDVLANNSDVIYAFDAGFIGEWGEWHCSSNYLATDANKIEVIKAVLAAFPANRQVGVRYPKDLQLFERTEGIDMSRLGSHQDCYASSTPDDSGTWSPGQVEAQKAMVGVIGVDRIVGGEACKYDPDRTTCKVALKEMPEMHFAYLAKEFEQDALDHYIDGGCFDEIGNKLGYRLQLDSSTLPGQFVPGKDARVRFTITNTGWASMTNTRPVFLVLESPERRVEVPVDVDPRTWKSGETYTVEQSISVPDDLPDGHYTVSVWLPDEKVENRSDARFSVQFASKDVWNKEKGLNVLATDVTVQRKPELAATGVTPDAGAAVSGWFALATAAVVLGGGMLAIRSRRRRAGQTTE